MDNHQNQNDPYDEYDAYRRNDSQQDYRYYEPLEYPSQDSEGQAQQEPVYAAPPVYGVNQGEEEGGSYYYEQPQQEEYYEENSGYYQEQQYTHHQEEPMYDGNAYEAQEEEGPGYTSKRRRQGQGEIVSTNQSINLTCTLGAFIGLFGLFLYFADQRSKAVRRMSVQSSALFIAEIVISIVLWVLGILFSVIPILGTIMGIVLWLVFIAMVIVVIFLKYQLMIHAYRGEAYTLPLVGEKLRKFE